MTELREPTNPLPLLALQDEEMRPTHPFPDMLRVQENWVAAAEKRALLRLAAHAPNQIGPDHLTLPGFALAAPLSAQAPALPFQQRSRLYLRQPWH